LQLARMNCHATQFEALTIIADNTNPDPDIRGQWIELARKSKVPIRCLWFKAPLPLCEHNAVVRALNQPVSRRRLVLSDRFSFEYLCC
jgi:bifunctional polynucleotide phosphatase/kinase